jgi:hypothetical protein
MQHLSSIFAIYLLSGFTTLYAENSESMSVYTYGNGKSKLFVLRLYSNGHYEHLYCTKSAVKVDSGLFDLKHNKLTFDSKSKRHGTQSLKEKHFILRGERLFEKRWEAMLGTNCLGTKTTDSIYFQSIEYNPLNPKSTVVKEENSAIEKNPSDQAKVYFLRLLNDFAPGYKGFIDTNYCGPGCYYSVVNNVSVPSSKDTTNDRLISSFNTVVHESTHHFNSYTDICVDPTIIIQFQRTPTYTSEKFLSIVPKEASDKIFRLKSYVGNGSGVSANLSGIYGIMDEFSAYRNGTKASLDAAISAKLAKNEKRKLDFIKESLPTYFAYYEFRLFISWYLDYGAKYQPAMHKVLMENTNFRVAFTLLEQGFKEDINIMEKLVAENPSVKWSYDYYEKDYVLYCKELLVSQEKTLSTFRIAGVTAQNYRQFITKAN